MLKGKNIIVGITGGIAAYKTSVCGVAVAVRFVVETVIYKRIVDIFVLTEICPIVFHARQDAVYRLFSQHISYFGIIGASGIIPETIKARMADLQRPVGAWRRESRYFAAFSQ